LILPPTYTRIELQFIGYREEIPIIWNAEGANPAQARLDETLRQKDPVPFSSGKSP
jgi:hypothetical protein